MKAELLAKADRLITDHTRSEVHSRTPGQGNGSVVEVHRRNRRLWGRSKIVGVREPDGRVVVGHPKDVVHELEPYGRFNLEHRYRLGKPPINSGYEVLTDDQVSALQERASVILIPTITLQEATNRGLDDPNIAAIPDATRSSVVLNEILQMPAREVIATAGKRRPKSSPLI